ncbi:MAG: ATP-binding cassette domain-containing protein [Micropruina sp.]|uniref:ABC transporter ATP-binding protein n=1 Tax=Micropruina sp. TaxID=2737536 RepID=UPI0039E51AB4
MAIADPRRPVAQSAGLQVRGLSVRVPATGATLLDEVDIEVAPTQILAIVGPSGAGKSTLLRALLGTLPADLETGWRYATLRSQDGPIDLATADRTAWRQIRRRDVRLVAQDPVAALTPLRRVGSLVAESARLAGRPATPAAVHAALEIAGFDDPERVVRRRAFELSGGMAQRVGVALALAAAPAVILADEPTTALDPDARSQVLTALRDAADAGAAVILVTHDTEAAARIADRTLGIVAGTTVPPESLPGAAPNTPLDRHRPSTSGPPALLIRDVVHGHGTSTVLDGVGLDVAAGEVVGLCGPSGTGKTTLLELVAAGNAPRAGLIEVCGHSPRTLSRRQWRRGVQLIPQHPREALNPWCTARQLVSEPLHIHRIGSRREREARAIAALASLGLGEFSEHRPAELSTGQCQRVGLARALILEPGLLLADEPVSSLDPALADEALALLSEAAVERGAGLLLVSHDHARLARVCHRVLRLADLNAGGCPTA